MARYEALRHLTVGEDTFAPGDMLESVDGDGRDWSAMIRHGEVREVVPVPGEEPRDENGDTTEMAEMRKRFDASYAERGEEVERLKLDVAERDRTIADLRGKLDEQAGIGGSVPENQDSDQSVAESSAEAQTLEETGGSAAVVPAYSVKDKGRGWFVVIKDGQEVTKSLRSDDLELFPAMTAEEQAAFVEANKQAD